MYRLGIILYMLFLLFCVDSNANHKLYLIHGYGGTGLEFYKIQNALDDAGYVNESFRYASFKDDVDSVGRVLYNKIKTEGYDSISFVTHSLGGIVVRTLYEYINDSLPFPFVHRIVMIAPPNRGSPVADFYGQFDFINFIAGPNIHNLITDSITGANRYPRPSCEVGVIIGNRNEKSCYTVPLLGDNDGVVLVESTMMGIEKDVCYVHASHIQLLFNKQVEKHVIHFLKEGSFEKLP